MRHLIWLFLSLAFFACENDNSDNALDHDDFETLPTGYKYKIHETNDEGRMPEPGEYVFFHAIIRKGDSLVMSSRAQNVAPVMVYEDREDANILSGPLGDLLMKMHEGDSATFLYPVDSMQQPLPGMNPGDIATFDVRSVKVSKKEDINEAKSGAEKVLAAYNDNTLDQLNTKTLDSGVKLVTLKEGDGQQVSNNSLVILSYYGILTDGSMFDNSFRSGRPLGYPQPLAVGSGMVIPGMEQALAEMRVGDQAVMIIPPDQGYGEAGSEPVIPPNSTLLFFVELQSAVNR